MNNPAVSNLPRPRAFAIDGGITQWFIQNPATKIVLFFAVHAVLALLMIQINLVSTLHALATLLFGFWLAATARQAEKIVYVIAYITGSEVLWRMTGAQIFWEFGKYAVVAILLVTILRAGQFRGFILPFLFFALLLPSLVMPMANTATEELRSQISFNLSGPLALMFCVWYFSQIRVAPSSFYSVFLFLVAPIVGISTVTLMGTFKASVLRFGNESNLTTSGGFGPNQVSAVLGLGVLALFLYFLVERKNRAIKPVLLILMIGLAVLSAMTFSRTGLYNAAIASIAATFYLIRDPRARVKLFGIVASIFIIANFLILPKLEEF